VERKRKAGQRKEEREEKMRQMKRNGERRKNREKTCGDLSPEAPTSFVPKLYNLLTTPLINVLLIVSD